MSQTIRCYSPDSDLSPGQFFKQIWRTAAPQVLLPPGMDPDETDIAKNPDNYENPIGLFSSGTTGRPKCIWNSYANLVKNAEFSAREFEIRKKDRLLLMAKPWHVAGLSWALMAEQKGCDYRFIKTEKGEHKSWFKAVKEYRPRYLFTVPAVLRSLYEQKDWFIPKIVYGGSAIDQWDYKELKQHADILYQGYGQTEAGGLISCHRVDLSGDISGTEHHCYGNPPADIGMKCKGTANKEGTIFIKSPTAIHTGFYDTGDEGYIDSEGRIHLLKRKKIS